jgi:quercetin dioxygenase-like cupin family protein
MEQATQDSLIAKVINTAALVDYQDGSVVSRAVIKKTTGNITFFSFDKGELLSEHKAPFDALVNVIDGSAEVIIAGESHKVNSGEMIIMPANVPHALKAIEKFKMMLTMIKE